VIRGSHEGRERNKEGVAGVEAKTQGKTRFSQTREGVATGTGIAGGATCTN